MSALRSEPPRVRVCAPKNPKPKRAKAHAKARAESPLAWLYRRRDKDGQSLISEAEFKAGERLGEDFWFAHMTPRTTSEWSLTAGCGGRRGAPGSESDMNDHVLRAKERVTRALKAVGPELAGVLIDVCCHMKGIEEAERKAGWPQRSGKVVLNIALTRLARHYGLIRDPDEARGGRPSAIGAARTIAPSNGAMRISPEAERARPT